MQTFECTKDGIAQCADVLQKGGVIAFPTDTVYGLGCDPYNNSAVKRVFEIKRRNESKPLPVLVADISVAQQIVRLGAKGRRLAEKFWPGALTIVAPLKNNNFPRAVTGGRDSLAVRVPANTCACSILNICKHIVGTSANLSGAGVSRDIDSIMKSLPDLDAIIIDRNFLAGKESTIIDLTMAHPAILRQGAIDSKEIMEILGHE